MYSTGVELKSKKKLWRINWHAVEKIVVSLHEYGMMKRTTIATRCGLRYDRCRMHLEWCESLKLVRLKVDDDGSELFDLTERGVELYHEQFSHT